MGDLVQPDFRAKVGASLITSQVKLVPHLNQPSLSSPTPWQRAACTIAHKHAMYQLCTCPLDELVLSRGLSRTEGTYEPLRLSAGARKKCLFVMSSSVIAVESLQWGVLLKMNCMKYLVIIPVESSVVLPSLWSQAGIGVCLLSHDCVKWNELQFTFMSFYNQRYGERLLDNYACKFLFLAVLTSSHEIFLIACILQYNTMLGLYILFQYH